MFRKRRDNDILLEILNNHAGVGLWDAVLHAGDPMHPKSRWTWSAEFRRLVGFADHRDEFPDVVQSWSDRLHPEDASNTFAVFGEALKNVVNKGAYDVAYRLQ
ncbi:PAS domain-containing protein, partial [Marinobacter sp. 1Y8]